MDTALRSDMYLAVSFPNFFGTHPYGCLWISPPAFLLATRAREQSSGRALPATLLPHTNFGVVASCFCNSCNNRTDIDETVYRRLNVLLQQKHNAKVSVRGVFGLSSPLKERLPGALRIIP